MISVRNYLFSVAVHILLLLLMLSWSLTNPEKDESEIQHVIMVQFNSDQEQSQHVQPQKKSSESKASRPKPNISSPSKKVPEEKPEIVKVIEKTTLHTSQKPKPKAESSQPLQEEAHIVKKVIPLQEKQPTEEEIAQKEKELRKSKRKSEFSALLSKAKDYTAASDNQHTENDNERDNTEENNDGLNTGSQKNIKGVLGNRKVLKTPVIRDKSQKKGKVVVRICVGPSGKVLSAKYTMMGSTTNDSYLIKLAEKGAMDYLFSASDNPKECGNVIIDFQLK